MTEPQVSPGDSDASDGPADPGVNVWRSEVQSRIAHYQSRRGRRVEGAFSMRFPFPADEIVETVTNPAAVSRPGEPAPSFLEGVLNPAQSEESGRANEQPVTASTLLLEEPCAVTYNPAVDTADLAPELMPESAAEPFVDVIPRPRPKRKVIAFPRQFSGAPEAAYRLADPVTSEVPRILDVPEELEAIPTTPFLDGLQLDPVKRSYESPDWEHVDLPFRAVRVSQRVFAGTVDALVAGIGVVIFAAVAGRIIPHPSITKPLILASIAMVGLLWSVYQYIFVVYAGRTLGMMAAKIRLRTFKGDAPNLRQRRTRVLGFYLSALSLGMGLMWVFVDVDALCWHDRLSHTHLSNRE